MLYRKQSGPTNIWLVSGAVLIALILGFLGGRLTAPTTTLEGLLRPAALHLRQASGALDIVGLEYARALQGNAQSRAASLKAVSDARGQVALATPLNRLDPAGFRALDLAFVQLERQMAQRQSDAAISAALSKVRSQLGTLETLSRLGQ